MNNALSTIVLVPAVFFIYSLIHLVVLRFFGSNAFIRNAAILLVVFLAIPILGWGEKLAFVAIWNVYMFSLICSRNSVSLRILDELLRVPGEALEKEKLLARFSDRESLSARIALMEKNRFICRVGPEEVELAPKARLIARGILMGRAIFGVRVSG